jgi:hypothetical protein
MTDNRFFETGIAAALFALAFVLGSRFNPLKSILDDTRGIVSFSAGMASAYVFVHVMPELHGSETVVGKEFDESARIGGAWVYLCALLGFLVYYGIDHMHTRLKQPSAAREAAGGEESGAAFALHLVGFGAYVFTMGYLLLNNLEETPGSIALYAIAIALHFVTIDHSLHREHGATYLRIGRWVLAAACIAGWAIGVVIALPGWTIALMVAFVSGAIIVNSSIMELPTEKDGRFLPFLIGGLLYGVILVAFG